MYGKSSNTFARFTSLYTKHWVLDDPLSYPSCNIHDHCPDLTSSTPVHNVSPTTTFTTCAVLLDDTVLAPALFSSSGDAPSLSALLPHIDRSPPADVSLLDNRTSAPMSIHPAHLTTVKDYQITATSPEPATANAPLGGTNTSTGMLYHSTVTDETSTATPPVVSTSPHNAVTLQHTRDLRSFSDVPDFPPSLPIPIPVNIFLTDPLLTSGSPMTRSDNIHSLSDSHSLIFATAPPGTPPLPSAPDLGTVAEGGGSTMATPDLLPQSQT
ncbi:hypothetical protein V8E53_010446 [Lactarius tabidus]